MSLEQHFADHIAQVMRATDEALAEARRAGAVFDGVVFHAGTRQYYHADDMAVHFRPTPHFARFTPVAGADHFVLARQGERPKLVQVVPRDFWYEAPAAVDHPYPRLLDVVQVESADEARATLGPVGGCAYIGNDPQVAAGLGIPATAVEPAALVAPLDWGRAAKTAYEVECVREAGRIAALGHAAVRRGVVALRSERELHMDYLHAGGILENECPYNNIIAWDDRAATLHYETKRATRPDPGHVLLIDAGGSHWGYASDVTRTYVRDGVHPVFRALLDGMETMQRELVRMVAPGVPYVRIHEAACRGIANLLCAAGVLKTKPEEAVARGLTRPFFPHGVGHHLGLQVHDVGGKQVTPRGDRVDSPPNHPFLRTTRDLAAGHIVTIEPGLYFIPMLLEPFRTGADARAFDWALVDTLVPCGGIRIEDDVLVTAAGHEDLTRPSIPGHRD